MAVMSKYAVQCIAALWPDLASGRHVPADSGAMCWLVEPYSSMPVLYYLRFVADFQVLLQVMALQPGSLA